ncbi:MAG: response regulator transcription factor [Saprospiraceae bacterium]
MCLRVFNADNHPILQRGIASLINQTKEMQWAGGATNGREAFDKIKAIQPDVALLDNEMPYMSGLEVAQALIGENIPTKFILFSLFKDRNFLISALTIGVKGYLLKESSEREIIECIEYVGEGKTYINASMTQFLVQANSANTDVLSTLSNQEANILKLIACQKTSIEIARMLFISPKTVANHRTNICKKLNLKSVQNSLLKWAIEHKELLEGRTSTY